MSMKNLLVVLFWLPTTFATLIFCLGYYSYLQNNSTQNFIPKIGEAISVSGEIPYQLYASLPKVLGTKTVNSFRIKSQDAVPELIYNYLKKNKSPMLESSESLISTAKEYELDPLLLVAIAQCESNLGKKMPNAECHNPFGWGIHSQGTLCFESWEQGYEAISKGLRKKYFNQGLDNPDDIMAMYTPASLEKGGSWAKCVNQFMNQLNNIKNANSNEPIESEAN